jgi:hypothetical protein
MPTQKPIPRNPSRSKSSNKLSLTSIGSVRCPMWVASQIKAAALCLYQFLILNTKIRRSLADIYSWRIFHGHLGFMRRCRRRSKHSGGPAANCANREFAIQRIIAHSGYGSAERASESRFVRYSSRFIRHKLDHPDRQFLLRPAVNRRRSEQPRRSRLLIAHAIRPGVVCAVEVRIA